VKPESSQRKVRGRIVGPNADLTNVDFRRSDLSNVELTGANLSGANLAGVRSGNIAGLPVALPAGWKLVKGYLVGAGADLSDADLREADLTGTTLTDTVLERADLSAATLAGVRSGGIRGTPRALPTGWKLVKGCLVGAGADLSYTSLKGADLAGCDCSDTVFRFAALRRVNLNASSLRGVRSGGIRGTPRALPSGWSLVKGYLVGAGADLSDADLREVDLSNAILTDAFLESADLSTATLAGVHSGGIRGIPRALPSGWSLVKGYLVGAGANLSDADLREADLTGTTLTDTVLERADLSAATLACVRSGGIRGTPRALPTGWKLVDGFTGGYLIGPQANLSKAYLSKFVAPNHVFVGKAGMSEADLSGVRSGGISGTPATLPSFWKFVEGYFVGAGADLSDADLREADLSDAILTDAFLESADLSTATLAGVRSGGIRGIPRALPTGWMLVEGYLVGPTANLSNADLTNVNLSTVDLSRTIVTGACLEGTNLSAARLAEVRSGGIRGTPVALPPSWKLEQGYLVGPTANLSNAELKEADLSGVTLYHADLSAAKFSGVRLDHADLSSANLTNTTLSDVSLDQTDLSNATLNGLRSSGIIGDPKPLPLPWRLVNGYLIGPNANLRGATLDGEDLSGANLAGANLEMAGLDHCKLRAASLANSNLMNARLFRADLSESDLSGGRLAGADLRRVQLSEQTVLSGARLVTTGYSETTIEPSALTCLSGVRWDASPIGEIADLSEIRRLGDDTIPHLRRLRRWQLHHDARADAVLRSGELSYAQLELVDPDERSDSLDVSSKYRSTNPYHVYQRYINDAAASYRGLAVALRGSGNRYVARRLEYRGRQLEGRLHAPYRLGRPGTVTLALGLFFSLFVGSHLAAQLVRLPHRAWQYTLQLGSSFIDLICGYGYRPLRIIRTYVLVILSFAIVYWRVAASNYSTGTGYGPPPRGWDSIAFSLIAFHGRGVIIGDIFPGKGYLVWVPALEAMLGLVIEAVFVAVIIRWLFRD
jgi:uncharacterized protein YjbI with pentapeptide repeats